MYVHENHGSWRYRHYRSMPRLVANFRPLQARTAVAAYAKYWSGNSMSSKNTPHE
jgi:hypothetical protein